MVSTVECLQLCLNRPLFQHVRGERPPLGSSRENTVGGGLRNLRRVCLRSQANLCWPHTRPSLVTWSVLSRVPVRQRSCDCATREQRRVKVENLSFSIFSVCLSLSVRPPSPAHKPTKTRHTRNQPSVLSGCLPGSQRSREADRNTRPGEMGHSVRVSQQLCK